MNNLGYRNETSYDKPVDEMLRMFSYYLGKQENRDYYYTTQDQSNCDLPTVWINGQKLTSMIDFMLGNAIKMIENIEPSVRATAKAVVNRKTQKLELALLKLELSGIFSELEKNGIFFTPTGSKEFETPKKQLSTCTLTTKNEEKKLLIVWLVTFCIVTDLLINTNRLSSTPCWVELLVLRIR